MLNIGSVNAYCGADNLLPYSLSKGGLMTLTRNVADAYCRTGVRVNQLNLTRDQSMAWTAANRDELIGAAKDAKVLAAQKYSEEKQQRGS